MNAGIYHHLLWLSLAVAGVASGQFLQITTDSQLPAAMVGRAYSQTFTVTGASGNVTWSLVSGTLPPGTSLTGNTLSGTPLSSTGSPFQFTIRAQDSVTSTNKNFTLNVLGELVITTNSLPAATSGAAYNFTLAGAGGQPPLIWNVTGLPNGLNFTTAGAISGIPAQNGNFPLVVTLGDSTTPTPFVVSKNLTLTVNPASGGPQITTASPLPQATVNRTYPTTTLTAAGGTTPYIWSVESGSTLPAGLTLNATTGEISGVPTTAGAHTFSVRVTDGAALFATKAFQITVNAPPSITTTALPNATVGVAYSQTVQATGGTAPLSWRIAGGSLPAGLSLAQATGVISGTPTTVGQNNVSIEVADARGATATAALLITVTSAAAPLAISTAALPDWTQNVAYAQTLAATGGSGTYSWSVTAGSLPAGMTLNAQTGAITGTPTAVSTATFTVQLSDGSATATRQFTIRINPPPTITTTTLPNGGQNQAYSTTLTASGGTPPLTWSIASGSLPQGLSLNASTGVISGTPAATGSFAITFRVTDAAGAASTAPLNLTVASASSITITTAAVLPQAVVNSLYAVTLAATGGSGTGYQWSLAPGSTLPGGLTLNPLTGAISGTPVVAGTSQFTIQVVDSAGGSASKQFTLTVAAAVLSITTASPLPDAVIGAPYTATVQAAGASGAGYVFTLAGGALPSGLTLNPNGTISGTPTQAGAAQLTIQVQDSAGATASKPFTLNVAAATLSITATALAAAALNKPYLVTIQAAGGVRPYTWSLVSGQLPPGLSLNPATGEISGSPSTTGVFAFRLRVRDGSGLTAEASFTLEVGTFTITTTSLPRAGWNVPYTFTLGAAGGTAPYTWAITAGQPPGIQLDPVTGTLSGIPTQAGNYVITIEARDVTGATASRQLPLVVSAGLAIMTASLPNGSTGTAYNQTLAASGGSGQYTWAVTNGALPVGLKLDGATGVISGTPEIAMAFHFMVEVSDSVGARASKPFQIIIQEQLAITTPSLPPVTAGVPYTQALAASGGQPPYVWSLSGGLPAGLTFQSDGRLSGTTTQTGTFAITVQVRDSSNATASKQFSLTVGSGGSLSIQPATLPNGMLGVAYNQTLTAAGGSPPYQWGVASGIPPQGLTLGPANGVLSGVPTVAGTYSFTVRVTDAAGATQTRDYLLVISGTALSITSASLPTAFVSVPYNTALTASGGIGSLIWSIASGQLPPGLTLNAATGVLSGIPAAAGSYSFTVQVVDSQGAAATRPFVLTVSTPLTITTTALPAGTVGLAYTQTLQASGGSGTGYTWSIVAGSLPPGLTLAPGTGQISGTPSSAGSSNFTVQVVDAAGGAASRALSITVNASLSITTSSLPNGQVGVAYNHTLSASGGIPPLAWSATALPAGIRLDAGTGALSGTPQQAGVFSVNLKVQDATGATASRTLSLTVIEGLTITTAATLPAATEGSAYTQTLAASGGSPPYTWKVTIGELPPGLSLASSTGTLSGTPSTTGSYSFIVQVTDAGQQTATKAFTLQVSARLTIVSAAQLPNATLRRPYRATLSVSGGSPPYTWSLAPGAQPPLGIIIERDGTISGQPEAAGVFSFTVQVSDSQGATASKNFTLTVSPALSITTSSPLPAAVVGAPYVQTLAASGGQQPLTWSVAGGNLPAGIELSSNGVLSGVPLAAGTFSFTVRVIDNTRATATASFALVVRMPDLPTITVTGLASTVSAAQQPRVSITLGSVFPIPVEGRLTLAFAPDAAVAGDDPAVVFSNGRRTVDFTIPANSLEAQLPDGFALQTGTVAGTLTLTISALRAGGQPIAAIPSPVTARVLRAPPVIRANSVRARRLASGLEVTLVGYSTPRELTSATFRFAPSPGGALQTTELTVSLADVARSWWESDASRPYGSQFTLTQRFNVQGELNAVGAVTVILSNSEGNSQPVAANFE